ncbi:MAG: SusE domain-containing protein [Reichenbachiella sp.]|uniref:SusE domain-containing protein n=1 Tax=Reichenbachiella sp. TaxID=2184521 RepID=UPI0032981385
MKNFRYIYILMAAVLFGACEEEMDKVMISSDPVSPVLTGPGADAFDFVLADKDETIEFSWEESDFGFDASISYTVEVATDDAFTNKVEIVTAEGSSAAALVDDVNTSLLGLGLSIGELATVHVRVLAMVNDNVEALASGSSSYETTPYETIYPLIYVPGAYQGWNPGGDIGRLYSYGFNSLYEGIIRIVDGANASSSFKLTPEANWDNAWGGVLTADGSKFTGTLDPSGGDFSIPAGTYQIKADVNGLTIELEATDDWGIIGSSTAGGWDNDTDLVYNGQKEAWEITTDLVAGELKFRANDGWDLNYGDTDADGTIDAGGDNIVVTAGNYTIRLYLGKETYELIAN